ncbi:MYND-type domain-containing protein [Favolaschia claudopus]|uniref:MYND-type domain-containing protein n=1 Tax=Favolaschia claudopus TaxID=2862362 RepID=A0AAW0AN69_9AGAR
MSLHEKLLELIPGDPTNSHLDDPELWSYIDTIEQAGEGIAPKVLDASRKRGDTGPLNKRIAERCELARALVQLSTATVMMSVMPEWIFGGGPAPLLNPPIVNGMVHCLDTVDKIVRTDYRRRKGELDQLPRLLIRIRHLLRVCYDFRVANQNHPDLQFCDWQKMHDVGFSLHRVGLCLQLDPSRLWAAMDAGGEGLEAFLLDDELDLGEFRKASIEIEKLVAADVEADWEDRLNAAAAHNLVSLDLAASSVAWFFGDISVAFIMHARTDNNRDRRWATKAMARLVAWSTSKTIRETLGDSLTDSMRPIYCSVMRGGLAALFGDWTNSTCCQLCEDALEDMPDEVWDNQTPASLLAITRELQKKLEEESMDRSVTYILTNAFFNIYRRYGLAPFKQASRHEKQHTPMAFYYFAHRIKQDGLQMRTREDWYRLFVDYSKMPRRMHMRYQWGNTPVARRWEYLELYGCCADDCPERRELLRLREVRVRGVRDEAVEARLDEWGAKPKACAACGDVAYCSSSCQRAHWAKHKPDCLKKRKAGSRS